MKQSQTRGTYETSTSLQSLAYEINHRELVQFHGAVDLRAGTDRHGLMGDVSDDMLRVQLRHQVHLIPRHL